MEAFIAIYEDTNGAKRLESVMVLICPMYSNTNLPTYYNLHHNSIQVVFTTVTFQDVRSVAGRNKGMLKHIDSYS